MYPTQEFVELGEFVRDLDPAVEVVSFGDPDVAIYDPRSLIGQIAFSRAVLTLTNADDPDCTIIAGYIDFVLVNPDDPDLDDAISLALLGPVRQPAAGGRGITVSRVLQLIAGRRCSPASMVTCGLARSGLLWAVAEISALKRHRRRPAGTRKR